MRAPENITRYVINTEVQDLTVMQRCGAASVVACCTRWMDIDNQRLQGPFFSGQGRLYMM